MAATPASHDDPTRESVTALQIFFDLVSVLGIGQLPELLVHAPHPRGIGQLLIILGVS